MQIPAPPSMPRFTRLGLLLAVLGLLGMPVEYRGGAARHHPHASLQFWSEAGQGSLSHHHPDGSHHARDEERHERLTIERLYRVPGDQEVPSLTSATLTQKYAPIAVAAPAALWLSNPTGHALAIRPTPMPLTGVSHAPPAPPPQITGVA